MNPATATATPRSSPWCPVSRWQRWLLLAAGIFLGQFWLYGPAFTGSRILLPLDLLAVPNLYLPPELAPGVVPQDETLGDLVLQYEPERRFLAAEYRKGNFPLWLPYQYAGSPLVWPRYSPFSLLACSTESPVILPWVELLAALVAGTGAYAFCRRSLKLGYVASLWAGWLYPLSGFFVLWQGFPTSGAVYWLPWLLFAVERVARSARTPKIRPVAGLALVTALVLVSGHIDVAGQVLVGAGVYALGCLVRAARRPPVARTWRRGLIRLTLGWALGFALAAPHVWPLLEYAPGGARMERRGAGTEERPPLGVSSLVQTVWPDAYGTNRRGSFWLGTGNQIESPASAYAGLLAALVLAPLAWGSRRHRGFVVLWLALAALGLSWSLDVPGVVSLLRLPGLNLFSHNRLTFLTAFAATALAAIGLDQLSRGEARWRRWHVALVAVLVLITGWAVWRSQFPAEPVATQMAENLQLGRPSGWIRSAGDLALVREWFARSSWQVVALGLVGLAGWGVVAAAPRRLRGLALIFGFVTLAEVALVASGRRSLAEPALYYPRLALPEYLAKAEPGRIFGYGCLLPTLSQTHGLNDVRGYDSVDPRRVTELLLAIKDSQSREIPYALTQWIVPRMEVRNGHVLTLPPVLDMLGVRYLLFQGTPPPQVKPAASGGGYWVLVNARALPRVFVPASVATETERAARIRRVTADDFNPRELAILETDVADARAGRGEGRVVAESPNRVTVEARLERGGLLVLGDAWSEGWRATVNGAPATVHCVNHCLRGVVVPAGNSTVEFSYRPRSVVYGFALSASGGLVLLGLLWFGRRRR